MNGYQNGEVMKCMLTVGLEWIHVAGSPNFQHDVYAEVMLFVNIIAVGLL